MGLYGILFLIAPLMASFFGNIKLIDLIRIGGLCAPLGGISIVHRSIMQRQFLYGRLSLIEASSAFIGSAVGIILGLLGFGVWSLIWSVLIYSSISSFLSILFSNSIRGNFFDFKSSTALWLFGLSAVIQRIIDYGSSNIDFIVVGKFFGEHALGIYSVAFMAITVPQLAFGAILVNVAISAFSRFQDDDQRLREAFIRLTKVVAGISIPFFVLIFLLAPEIMQTIGFIKHSNKWIPAAPLIKILAPMGLIYCLNSYPSIVWIAKGKIKLRIIWALFSLVTMSGAVIIGAKFGVSGICKAILTRAIIVFPISCYVNYRTFGLSPVVYLKAITSPLCCGVLAMIVLQGWALIGGSYFTHHSYLKLLCYSITCMLIYGLTLRIVSKGVYRDFCSVIKELVKTKRV
jgi:O-antigen/teichoic acid export membrane protein